MSDVSCVSCFPRWLSFGANLENLLVRLISQTSLPADLSTLVLDFADGGPRQRLLPFGNIQSSSPPSFELGSVRLDTKMYIQDFTVQTDNSYLFRWFIHEENGSIREAKSEMTLDTTRFGVEVILLHHRVARLGHHSAFVKTVPCLATLTLTLC
jgi:hypothetical protein